MLPAANAANDDAYSSEKAGSAVQELIAKAVQSFTKTGAWSTEAQASSRMLKVMAA